MKSVFLRNLSLFISLALLVSSCATQRGRDLGSVDRPIKTETIIIDAGHGGKDTGALSKRKGYVEKELTLKTAFLLRDYLRDMGYHVVLTRRTDDFIPLDTRAEIANMLKADLFVSIHYNYSSNREANGVEVYYYKEGAKTPSTRIVESKQLGQKILSRIAVQTGAASRGVKEANFAVVRQTAMPAILIEGGFLSNTDELDKIQSTIYRQYLARAIARGLDEYLTHKRA